MNRGLHETQALDEYLYQSFTSYPGGEMAYKLDQYDSFYREVEKGQHDDFITDLFVNDLDYALLVEYLGRIQNASKEETPSAYEALGRYIDRKIGTSIEDKIADTETDYDG